MGGVQLKRRVGPPTPETRQHQIGAEIDLIFRQAVGSINAAVESGGRERTEMVPTTAYHLRQERRKEAGELIEEILYLMKAQGDAIADGRRERLENRLLSFFHGSDSRAEVMRALDAMETLMREGAMEVPRDLEPEDAAILSGDLRALNRELWNMRDLDKRLESLESTGLDPVDNTTYGRRKAREIARDIMGKFLDFFGERGHQLLQRIETLRSSGVDSETGKKLGKKEAENKVGVLRRELNALIQEEREKIMDRIEKIEIRHVDTGHRVEFKGWQAEEVLAKIISDLLRAVEQTVSGPDYMPHPSPSSSPRLNWTLDENRVVLLFALKDYLKLINSGNYGENEREAIRELTRELKAAFLGSVKEGALSAEEWYGHLINRSVPAAIAGREQKTEFIDFMGDAIREYGRYVEEGGVQPILSRSGGRVVVEDEFLALLLAMCISTPGGRQELRASEETLLRALTGVRDLAESGAGGKPRSEFTAQR